MLLALRERAELGAVRHAGALVVPSRAQPVRALCAHNAASDATSAAGIATAPVFRKVQPLTFSPCLRSATSHRMVASDPVTDRFGPRSMPMATALWTTGSTPAPMTTEPAIRPAGRLFMRLHANATMVPAAMAAAVDER